MSGRETLHCSFCGKSQHGVRQLIAGPTAFICDECIALCDTIIADDKTKKAEERLREIVREELVAAAALVPADSAPAKSSTKRFLARLWAATA